MSPEPEASTSPDAAKERAAMSFGKLPDETAEEVIRSALRAERANERALIVRYLHDHLLNDLAERIERGDHLKAHA